MYQTSWHVNVCYSVQQHGQTAKYHDHSWSEHWNVNVCGQTVNVHGQTEYSWSGCGCSWSDL